MRKYRIGDRFLSGPYHAEIIGYESLRNYRMRFYCGDGKERESSWSESGITKKMKHISTPKSSTYLPEDLFSL